MPKQNQTKKLKILFLSHKIPFPPNRGDRIPSFFRMKHLSKKNDLSIAFPCFYEEELKLTDEIKKYCVSIDTELIKPFNAKLKSLYSVLTRKPLTLPYFYSKKLHKKILKRIEEENFDLIYIFCSSMAQYVMDVKGIKKIIDLVDVDSHKWLQYSKKTFPPLSTLYYLEWKKLKKYEIFLAKNCECTILISENEKKLFIEHYINNVPTLVVPNGVNLKYFRPNKNYSYKPQKIVFLGAMDYYANVDGVAYFHDKIFPIIKKEIPDAKFYIIGSRPAKAVQKLASKDVIVTGFVDDVRTYLNDACVCAVPLRIARGIQNKILEAMASGIPVVTSPICNDGVAAVDGENILVGKTPQEFAKYVTDILSNHNLRDKFARNGRKFVEEHYSWEINLNRLEKLFVETCLDTE